MRKHRAKPKVRARAGQTMIAVIVMTMVFFILGASVLTAASTATAAASARVVERQGYYYARSLLKVFNESLQRGALGDALLTALLEDATQNGGTQADVVYTAAVPFTMQFAPDFGEGPLSELTGEGEAYEVQITCIGRTLIRDASVSIRMRAVELEFTLPYKDIDTRMYVRYGFNCYSENYSAQGGEEIAWRKEWTIKQAG